jgi:hypothetical protein
VNRIVTIEHGGVLEIAPGTKMLFDVNGGIVSCGTLRAIGTPNEPIIFTAFNKEKRWKNITFFGRGSKESILENCEISNGGGIQDEFVQIKLLKKYNYSQASYGGGIY